MPPASVRLAIVLISLMGCAAQQAAAPRNDAGYDSSVATDATMLDVAELRDMPTNDAELDATSALDLGSVDASMDAAVTDAGDSGTTDAGSACTYSCSVTIAAGTTTTDCVAPYVTRGTATDGQFRAAINMMSATELDVHVTLCNPLGFTVHVADSPNEDGFGGNGATSASEIHLNGTTLAAYANMASSSPGTMLFIQNNLVPSSGCREGTVVVRDSSITIPERGTDWSSPYLLRLNEAGTAPDAPDATWYLGLNQTYQGRSDRVGTGVTGATICVR